ncbi:MAG: hypothetical protein ABJB11_15205 [Ferruginibacter sp.]
MNPKRSFYNWLAYLSLMLFILYWASIFIMAMPRNSTKLAITQHVPRFKNMFGYSWKLFTPPATYNPRLYIVVRDSTLPDHADSTEILLPMVKEKQAKAPFNNPENIIDYLVNTSVTSFTYIIWHNDPLPGNTTAADSLTRRNEIGKVANHILFKANLATINNYCSQVIQEKQLFKKGNEARFVITEKLTRPFNEIGNIAYKEKELLVYETGFAPIAR